MLEKALELYTHPLLTLLLAPRYAKKLFLMIFLYKCIEQQGKKNVTLYPSMLPRISGLEIVYVASPYHPEALKKISDTTFTEH